MFHGNEQNLHSHQASVAHRVPDHINVSSSYGHQFLKKIQRSKRTRSNKIIHVRVYSPKRTAPVNRNRTLLSFSSILSTHQQRVEDNTSFILQSSSSWGQNRMTPVNVPQDTPDHQFLSLSANNAQRDQMSFENEHFGSVREVVRKNTKKNKLFTHKCKILSVLVGLFLLAAVAGSTAGILIAVNTTKTTTTEITIQQTTTSQTTVTDTTITTTTSTTATTTSITTTTTSVITTTTTTSITTTTTTTSATTTTTSVTTTTTTTSMTTTTITTKRPVICPSAIWHPNGTTVAGSSSGNSGSTSSLLNGAYDVRVDSALNVYVADYHNERFMKWPSGSTNGTVIGPQLGHGSGDVNHINTATTLSFDSTESNVYLSDTFNCRILKLNIATGNITVIIGSGCGTALNQFHWCDGLYVDRFDNLYVSDWVNDRVLKFPPNANTSTNGVIVAGTGVAGSALSQLNTPWNIYVDESDNDALYIADYGNDRVMKWLPNAKNGTVVAGGHGGGPLYTQLNNPQAVFVDSFGTVYVADYVVRGRGRRYTRGSGGRGNRGNARGFGSRGGRRYTRGRGRYLHNGWSDPMDTNDQQTVSTSILAELDINTDPKPFFVNSNVTLDQHIRAQTTNLPRYIAALFTLNENNVEIGQKAKACALAAAWCRHDHTLANQLLRCRQLFTLTEVLKAVMMLDAGRQLRVYEKQLKRLELNKTKPTATTLGKMKNNIDNLTKLKASIGSVSGALTRHIKRWTRTLTRQELEYFALHMPTEPWKKLANIIHFNPNKDFPSLPWFLPFCFGIPAPEETMVARCRTLTNENVNDLIKEFKIPYSHLKSFKEHLNNNSKARIAASEDKLDTILWYYEDLQCPEVDDIINERLEDGEKINLPYGKLMERLLVLRKLQDTQNETTTIDNIQNQNSVQLNKNKCYSHLLSIAESQLAKIKLSLESPVGIMGDASYSMDVAIRTATILASLLTAVCSAKLNFFHTQMFLPAFTPKTIEDVLTLALTTKAHGLTANAAGLVSYYDNKEIIKTFVMVTDEIENTDVHTADGISTRFFNLFMKYRSEIYPAKLVFISFLDNQHDQGQMYKEFLNANVPDVIQFKFNGKRPDLTKLDNLLGLLSTGSSQTFSDQLEKLQSEFEQNGIESVMTNLINKQTNDLPPNEV